jgi:predicted enzyme related to lactoylglutathione lyase
VSGIRTFVDPENPKRVAVLMDVPDIDAVMAKLQAEGAEVMSADGVRAETLVILVEHTH